MIELPPLSRRKVVSAGAWAVPAVVVASAAPSYATSSGEPFYSLSVPSVAPGATLHAYVTISGGAFPVAPGSVTLAIEHIAGSGSGNVAPPAGWTWAQVGPELVFTAPPSPASLSDFGVSYVGAPQLRFTLVTPKGTFTQVVQLAIAAARVQGAPPVDDPSATRIELP